MFDDAYISFHLRAKEPGNRGSASGIAIDCIQPATHPNLILAICYMSVLITGMDVMIVNVALPIIQEKGLGIVNKMVVPPIAGWANGNARRHQNVDVGTRAPRAASEPNLGSHFPLT
jgi:hypothetical protein